MKNKKIVTFMAFDRPCRETFYNKTDEEIQQYIHALCETAYVVLIEEIQELN